MIPTGAILRLCFGKVFSGFRCVAPLAENGLVTVWLRPFSAFPANVHGPAGRKSEGSLILHNRAITP
jgi:hypothetical protein